MIGKAASEITEADLHALIEGAVREDQSLEYKEALPGTGAEATREFCADAAALANTGGGDIIFGVRESRDEDGRATGVPGQIVGLGDVNVDQAVLRLEDILRQGVLPRVMGVQMTPVPCQAGHALLVRVPRSWAAPHMVKGNYRFYGRSSAGKFPLDVGQIRDAFLRSAGIADRIRDFRAERLLRIKSGDTPVPLRDGPPVVLHLVSFQALESAPLLDLVPLFHDPGRLPPLGAGGWNIRMNLDGVVSFTGSDREASRAYTQVFRAGALEAVATTLVTHDEGVPWFGSVRLEQRILGYARTGLHVLLQLGAQPPFALMVSLLGVKGLRVAMERERWEEPEFQGFEREDLLLPEVVIESGQVDLGPLLRPIFDVVWQAVGWDRSKNFNDAGDWKPHTSP